jgi:hypothetical protein
VEQEVRDETLGQLGLPQLQQGFLDFMLVVVEDQQKAALAQIQQVDLAVAGKDNYILVLQQTQAHKIQDLAAAELQTAQHQVAADQELLLLDILNQR